MNYERMWKKLQSRLGAFSAVHVELTQIENEEAAEERMRECIRETLDQMLSGYQTRLREMRVARGLPLNDRYINTIAYLTWEELKNCRHLPDIKDEY